jgi:hypothetical protein
MQKVMLAGLAAAFMSVATVANAADMTGTITSVDTAKDTITLDSGQVVWLPSSMNIASYTVGEKVKVTYTQPHHRMHATAITPAT